MSKSCGCSVLGLWVKSSTSSSEVEGWVRMIRGICHIIEWEGREDQGWKTRTLCKTAHGLPTKMKLPINRCISSAFSLSDSTIGVVTYPHCVFPVLQRVFFQFRRDLIHLIFLLRLRNKEKMKKCEKRTWLIVAEQLLTTHNVVAIADNSLNALGQTPLSTLHQCCFGRLALWGWQLLSCRVPLVPWTTGEIHLSWWTPVSEDCHPDAASCIPEGTDCLVVGRPLHVQAVDLERETSARSRRPFGAAKLTGAEVRGGGTAYVLWKHQYYMYICIICMNWFFRAALAC